MKDRARPRKRRSSEGSQWQVKLYDPSELQDPAEEERYVTLSDEQSSDQDAADGSDAA